MFSYIFTICNLTNQLIIIIFLNIERLYYQFLCLQQGFQSFKFILRGQQVHNLSFEVKTLNIFKLTPILFSKFSTKLKKVHVLEKGTYSRSLTNKRIFLSNQFYLSLINIWCNLWSSLTINYEIHPQYSMLLNFCSIDREIKKISKLFLSIE